MHPNRHRGYQMAKHKSSKKTSKVQSQAGMVMPTPYREKKCVRITEADNGFTVSTYGEQGEKLKVAPSIGAALRHTRELMGAGSGTGGQKEQKGKKK